MGCTTAASLNYLALLSCGMIVASNDYEQGQVIISSIADRSACVGEDVTLTCAVPGTGRLTWVIGSRDNTILFNLADDSSLTTQTDSTGQFTASLVHYSRDKDYFFLGNLTSTLHTRVDPLLTDYPVTVLCNDGITEMIRSSTINIAGTRSHS